jgi:hypothetical protein
MILVYVDNDSATLWVGAEFIDNKIFYTTYKDGKFYCQPGNPASKGTSFFINGLDEVSILDRALKAAITTTYKDSKSVPGHGVFASAKEEEKIPVVGNYDIKKFFKGTTFNGITENAFGYVAALLKEGLGNLEIHIGVKMKWTAQDLVKYINAIQRQTELSVQLA